MKQTFFKISERVQTLAGQVEAQCAEAFARVNEVAEYNSLKVLSAFQEEWVSEGHLVGTTGYGYSDRGRDKLDAVFARAFGAEDCIVRHSIVSGTAAISTALFGVLRPGDTVVCLAGKPHDTLHQTFGIGGKPGIGSLTEFGVIRKELDLLPDGKVDLAAIPGAVEGVKVAYIQRSRGYSLRPSLMIDEIAEIIKIIRKANPKAIVVVDNCYGEFVETREPTDVGADLMAGSLIKNPGGGIAPTGGYIAGKEKFVEMCAHRLTAPGLGRDVGCAMEHNKDMYLGFFYAPGVVASAVKTAIFAAGLYEAMGCEVTPKMNELRTDIIQAVVLGSAERLVSFCQGIQKGGPVDCFVTPEAWDMPGYDSQIVMAAGTFHMGASIELSADGPIRPPFAAWMQGGLNYPTGKLGAMLAAEQLTINN
ncbi:MAG: methionine gamma-lyase family protein [Oscillospiraceae bacterium]|nr:methionine gamma-lyase family protein [Oscillospiraceae bacterium]